jgi:hypothetical protein
VATSWMKNAVFGEIAPFVGWLAQAGNCSSDLFGKVLAGIHHVMVRFIVRRQTRAFVEPAFTESPSAKQVV